MKNRELHDLVRLCGSSLLYLPADYAVGSLKIPTCFRATAQYLVQHGLKYAFIILHHADDLAGPTTRGIFHIGGSHQIIEALYNHFCATDSQDEVVSGTVRCPTLPDRISYNVHDVGGVFRKFLSGLPGGVLGSTALFDAFLSIQSQLHVDPELNRTKDSKIRARLIALAVGSIQSQYRRELICAVFGLLCMIGRAAETTPREDEKGRPLPTSGLMGYNSLGIIFGPVLIGEWLDRIGLQLAHPHTGIQIQTTSSPKSRRRRSDKFRHGDMASKLLQLEKAKTACSITEMLITHWREVVRHMRNLDVLKRAQSTGQLHPNPSKSLFLRPSLSEGISLRRPPQWHDEQNSLKIVQERLPISTCAGKCSSWYKALLTPSSGRSSCVRLVAANRVAAR